MATFNLKPDKIRYNSSISTLDVSHQKKVAFFNKRKKNINNKKEELIELKKNIELLKEIHPKKITEAQIKEKYNLKEKINILEEEIYDIENNISEIKYYSTVDDILMDYYDLVENKNKNANDNDNSDCIKKKRENIVILDELDKLNKISKGKKINKVKRKTKKKTNRNYVNNTNIINFFTEKNNTKIKEKNKKKKKKYNRASLYNTYKILVNNEPANYNLQSRIKKCKTCNVEKTLIHSEGIYVCRKCGEVETIIIDSEKPNYKDPTPEKSGYPYKRINHFNEWLSQFQAKESTCIPDEVFTSILNELKKIRFTDLSKLNIKKVKIILKKLRLQQYYEHIPHIISKITGNNPPEISRETEEVLRHMFKDIQLPFEKYCPKTRTNFLSYSYVLHKFCQLLELDNFIKCFPLLKSREKLRQQEKIWKNICKELDWQYYPSI
jgi:hypothetical protein